MTILYKCRWACPKCPIELNQENEIMDIYKGLVRCPDCKVKMELRDVRRVV
jgi:hypothetical protein